jgi:hypothetical protein
MKPEDDAWLSNVKDVNKKGDMKEVEVISEKNRDSSKIADNAADTGLKVTQDEDNVIMETDN